MAITDLEKLEQTYQEGQAAAAKGAFSHAALMFSICGDYKDAAQLSIRYKEQDLAERYHAIINKQIIAESQEDFYALVEEYKAMGDYEDCVARAEECQQLGDAFDFQLVYEDAYFLMQSVKKSDVSKAKREFVSLGDYKDSAQKAEECESRIVNIIDKAENRTIKAVLYTLLAAIGLILVAAIII